MNKAAQAYFQTKVSTTDQGQLLLLLYDGALKFLQQAREKMLEKDYAAKGILISKVIDIINELTNTLNLEKGGTLAENLNNLYFLCTTRLLQANLKMNVEQLDSVSDILSGLRSAYAEIIETPEAKRASAQIAAKLNVDASITQRAAMQTRHNVVNPSAMGMMQARNAYGSMQRSMPTPAAAPTPAPAAPSSGIAAVMASPAAVKPAEQHTFATTEQAPVAASTAASAAGLGAPVAEAPSASSPSAPSATTAPSTPAAPAAPKGFGVKGFGYNKAFGK